MEYYPKNVKDLDQEDYDEMLEEIKFLNRLREAGVDNWEGVYYARQEEDDDDDEGDWRENIRR